MEIEAVVNWVAMTTAEAIVAATSRAAEALEVKDLGMVSQGKSADFIVLDANPLDDIRNTRRIAQVHLRGKAVDRDAMRIKWVTACTAASATRTA